MLYSKDVATLNVLTARAKQYITSDDSGFDLEVYEEVTPEKDVRATYKLLDTRVYAKVVDTPDAMSEYYNARAFSLMARSSLPSRGWILGNGVGLIDTKYCDTLKAALVCVDHPTSSDWRRLLFGQRCVQIVAPDLQPFGFVKIVNDYETWLTLCKLTVADGSGAPHHRGGGIGRTGE
jgi:dUTPase